jgi:hypothetical protein
MTGRMEPVAGSLGARRPVSARGRVVGLATPSMQRRRAPTGGAADVAALSRWSVCDVESRARLAVKGLVARRVVMGLHECPGAVGADTNGRIRRCGLSISTRRRELRHPLSRG